MDIVFVDPVADTFELDKPIHAPFGSGYDGRRFGEMAIRLTLLTV